MGPRQEAWFYRRLRESSKSKTRWRIVGNQIVFSRMIVSPEGLFNYDAWDGYIANRNRTLKTLYNNKISNTIMLAGDSHAAWVSDLVWLDGPGTGYDSVTGAGSVGVEFAGSAVTSPSPLGENITMSTGLFGSTFLTSWNPELQWQDLYYRGYFELTIGYDAVKAAFFGMPDIKTRNGFEVSLANFTVKSGENKLQRHGETVLPGGKVEAGALQRGETLGTNVTFDTGSGRYFVFKGRK